MQNSGTKQTLFDTLVTNRKLQLVKAVLPYIDYDSGKMFAVFTKFEELKNTMNLSPGAFMVKDDDGTYKTMQSDKPLNFNELFNTIKDYLSEDEAEMIDSMLGMMDLFSMDENSKDEMLGSYMEMFKDMF